MNLTETNCSYCFFCLFFIFCGFFFFFSFFFLVLFCFVFVVVVVFFVHSNRVPLMRASCIFCNTVKDEYHHFVLEYLLYLEKRKKVHFKLFLETLLLRENLYLE